MADEGDRRLFLVEHDLRGLSPRQLATVHRALDEAVRLENQRGCTGKLAITRGWCWR